MRACVTSCHASQRTNAPHTLVGCFIKRFSLSFCLLRAIYSLVAYVRGVVIHTYATSPCCPHRCMALRPHAPPPSPNHSFGCMASPTTMWEKQTAHHERRFAALNADGHHVLAPVLCPAAKQPTEIEAPHLRPCHRLVPLRDLMPIGTPRIMN